MKTDSIEKWQEIMNLCCATQKAINITSYGDWDFSLMRIKKEQVARPLYEIIQQYESQYQDFQDQEEQNEMKIDSYPLQNTVKGALDIVTVQINYTQQQFKEKYGFWQIKDFNVYNRDGNSSSCSFQDENYFYFGTFSTS